MATVNFRSGARFAFVQPGARGSSDVIARVIGEQMGKHLGKAIVNENVAGAGGVIALTRAANASQIARQSSCQGQARCGQKACQSVCS